jgi:hypothetical protein
MIKILFERTHLLLLLTFQSTGQWMVLVDGV